MHSIHETSTGGHGVHNVINNIGSHNFQFPFSFQEIIHLCLNLSIQVQIMKFIHNLLTNKDIF